MEESALAETDASNPGYHNGPARAVTDQGYYGGRMPASRPGSVVDGWNGQGGPYRPRFAPPRMASEPVSNGLRPGQQPIYPTQAYQRSYDTVTSASGSNSTEAWGNSTDPSSENSSVDRIQATAGPPKPDPGEAYGFTGFGEGPALHASPGYGEAYDVPPQAPPHLPPKDTSTFVPRAPIKLGSSSIPTSSSAPPPPQPPPEKRKSWFKRFGKG